MSGYQASLDDQYLRSSINTRDDFDERSNLSEDNIIHNESDNYISTKIVENKVLSSLVFAKLLFFNWYYMWLVLFFEVASVIFHFYIFKKLYAEEIIRLVLILIWFFAKIFSLYLGKTANVQGNVINNIIIIFYSFSIY